MHGGWKGGGGSTGRDSRSRSMQRMVRRHWPFCFCVDCFGGGLGAGFGNGTLPENNAVAVFCGGFCGLLLVFSAMTSDQFQERTWQLLFDADYQVRYWRMYEFWAGIVQGVLRSVLALSGCFALTGLFLADRYQFSAAVVGAIAALLSTVVLPSIGWDSLLQRVSSVRNGWIDVRDGLQDVWDDIDSSASDKLERRADKWAVRARDLEQTFVGLPVIKRFQNKGYAESEALCAK